MAYSIRVPGGILSMVESKAKCPHCERVIPIEEIEDKWLKQDKHFMRMKCKCKRFIGIAANYMGDFVAYEL
jgi:hypothetical protein